MVYKLSFVYEPIFPQVFGVSGLNVTYYNGQVFWSFNPDPTAAVTASSVQALTENTNMVNFHVSKRTVFRANVTPRWRYTSAESETTAAAFRLVDFGVINGLYVPDTAPTTPPTGLVGRVQVMMKVKFRGPQPLLAPSLGASAASIAPVAEATELKVNS